MIWQDIAISIANIIFAYALIPQVYQGFKDKKGVINWQTSSLNTLGLYVISFAFLSLGLYFSSIMSFIVGSLWLLLFIQKIIY